MMPILQAATIFLGIDWGWLQTMTQNAAHSIVMK